MLYQLPPVGNKIDCHVQHGGLHRMSDCFSPDIYFFSPGAVSLAAAIMAAAQQSKVERPEVLLPAYACSELVSAVLYAGAKPVLVDFAVDRPWMDLHMMFERITNCTCAVIAVSLLGLIT